MREMVKKNKLHIFLSVLLAIILSVAIGGTVGIKQNNSSLGYIGGIISFFIYAVTFLIVYKIIKDKAWIIYYSPLLIILFLFFIGIIFFPTLQMYKYSNTREVPNQILSYLNQWNLASSVLRIIQTLLALTSIICSLWVALQISSDNKKTVKWVAFASALSISLLTSFHFGERANNYRTAWRMLNKAVIKYELTPDYSMKDLIDQYYEGEKIIGDVKLDIK